MAAKPSSSACFSAAPATTGCLPGSTTEVSLAGANQSLQAAQASLCPSLDPAEFVWGAPSPQQHQQQIYQLAFLYCALPPAFVGSALAAPAATCQVPSVAQRPGAPVFSGGFASPPPATPGCSGLYAPTSAPASFAAAATPAPAPLPAQQPSVAAPAPQPQAKPTPVPPAKAPAKASGSLAGAKKSTSGGPASRVFKSAKTASSASPAIPASATAMAAANPVEAFRTSAADIELDAEDIRKLLEDDKEFLQFADGAAASEGSNGSSATAADGHMLQRASSHNSLSASGALNDGLVLSGTGLGSAFDVDMDDHINAVPEFPCWTVDVPPCKAGSGDLNNMACPSPSSSPTKAAVGPVAKAAAGAKASGACGGKGDATAGAGTKVTLRVKGAGVQKGGSKASTRGAKASATLATADDCVLTAADLSRLLGEDDNRIPDGWDLDLDFENPFSTPITAC